jgi:hypothetical protein
MDDFLFGDKCGWVIVSIDSVTRVVVVVVVVVVAAAAGGGGGGGGGVSITISRGRWVFAKPAWSYSTVCCAQCDYPRKAQLQGQSDHTGTHQQNKKYGHGVHQQHMSMIKVFFMV